MKTYTVKQARQMVELCYGKPISDRTWRRWRYSLGIRCNEHQVTSLTERQALWIAGYAYLKRLHPKVKHNLEDVVKILENDSRLHQMFYGIDVTQNGFYGRELPAIIQRMTGKQLSLRTFYRIAEKQNIEFSINGIYDNCVLNIFLGALDG